MYKLICIISLLLSTTPIPGHASTLKFPGIMSLLSRILSDESTEGLKQTPISQSHTSETDLCSLPMVKGPCRRLELKYYFDSSTQTCKLFAYGGCYGNKNNFDFKANCEKKCLSTCSQPRSTGPCPFSIRRFYFDQKSGKCKQFGWGGCLPNENNFHTMHQCQERCEPDAKKNDICCPSENAEKYN